MAEKQKILLWNHEGKSNSEIALLLGLDVKTVRSYIKENEMEYTSILLSFICKV